MHGGPRLAPMACGLSLVLLAAALSHCKGDTAVRVPTKPGTTPKDTLERYFSALERGDDEGSWELLCTADQKVRPRSEARRLPDQDSPGAATHTIKSISVEGGSARAVVSVNGPDPDAVLNEMSKYAKEKKTSPEDVQKMMKEIAANKDLPRVTRDQMFLLVQEIDGWRVDVGFAWLREVFGLLEKARELEEAGHGDEAERIRAEVERKKMARQVVR